MQPKLKGDTFYLPVPDGIYFRNNQGSFKLKGKVISRWVEHLAPYLNGEHTLDEITGGLDPQKRAMVTDLVHTLTAHGFVKDTSQDLPHTLSPTEQETYAAEIAFIDSFSDSAASRFERFREQQVLLIGSGLTLTGLVHASLKCGLRQVALITTEECETNTRRHQEYLDLFHQGDPRQTLREIAAPAWQDEAQVLSTLQPFDMVLHVSDRPMLARASMLNRLCVTHHKHLLQAMLVDDHAWIGPLVRPDQQGCWECAWRRLQGNLTNHGGRDLAPVLPAYALQDQSTAPLSRFVALPTAALVANRLSFEVFKSLTQAGPVETADHLIEIDLETLRTQKHSFLPHPLCSACQHPAAPTEAQFLDTIQQLEQGEPLDEDLFSNRAVSCFEARLGLFRSLDEADFVQLPLSVCQAVVSNPLPDGELAPSVDNPREVLGWGTTFGTARLRAALRACEIYAASLVDRRRLLVSPTYQERMIKAQHVLSIVPLAEAQEWTWAVDLQTRRAWLVPAPLVYPVLHGQGEACLGVSAGLSWTEALSWALLNVCRSLTMTHLASATQPYPQVDLAVAPLSPEGTRLRSLLEQIDAVVTVYDVTGPLGVPTLAICLQDKTVAYCTHVQVAQALQDGLEQALLCTQLSAEQIPSNALPDLPLALRGDKAFIEANDAPQEWPDRKLWLQEALKTQGWRAFALPLDHDPAFSQVLPYIVRVLVTRA